MNSERDVNELHSDTSAGAERRDPLTFALLFLAACLAVSVAPIEADESAEELAKKLANPISSLISLPLQLNYDSNLGPLDDGDRVLLNIQPVVPISLSEKWNLISRTILPVIDQQDLFPGSGGQSGIGDVVQSLFFSPAQPTASGLVWGVGPVLLLPTGSDDLLTADKWGLGPTFVALKQTGPRTKGFLFNHIESFAGEDARRDVSSTFFQPFVSHTTPKVWTFSANLETSYDWEGDQWSVPVNFAATKLAKWGNQRVQAGGGIRYWIESPDSGAEGLGFRLILTFLYPK